MKVIAHRGASGHHLENSREAIEAALNIGVDAIEIDIRPDRVGIPVVFHDSDLKRMMGIKSKVNELHAEELQNIYKLTRSAVESTYNEILTLDQVIELISGQTELLIEIKMEGKIPSSRFLSAVLSIIDSHNAYNWCTVQSFNDHVLKLVNAISKKPLNLHQLIVFRILKSGLSLTDAGSRILLNDKNYISGINVDYRFLTPGLLKSIHKKGKTCYVWTVNDEPTMARFVKMGVDGIITNYPLALKDYLSNTVNSNKAH